MKKNLTLAIKLLVVGLACLAGQSSLAHHSFTSHYDPSKSVELTGTVSKFTFRNPHAFVFINVEDDAGGIKNWEVELHSKAVLSRMGLSLDNLQTGDTITVTAWPNREPGNPLVFGIGMVIADGTKIGEHPEIDRVDSVYTAASGIARLQGRWKSPLVRGNGRGTTLPLNEAGETAVANFSPKNSPANTCEVVNLPTAYHVPYLYDIKINDESVLISYEIYSIERRIPMGGVFAQTETTGMLGLARAKIEGDELIIESKDYPVSGWGLAQAGDFNGRGVDVPSSSNKTLVERFSVSDDGLTLEIDYELSDPSYLRETYVNTVTGQRVSDDETIYPYDCDIESAIRYTQ